MQRSLNNRICPRCGRKSLRRNSSFKVGTPRWSCRETTGDRKLCYSTAHPEKPVQGFDGRAKGKPPVFKRALGGVTRLLITSAQNATPVHAGFLKALQTAARHLKAELVVIPTRYKNPTSQWTEDQQGDEWWAKEVVPYLCNQRKQLGPNLVLLGDVKTQPTAVQPLTGYEAMTHGESGILGHAKLQLRAVPTPQGSLPKLMSTTGACTIPSYTDSKAGKLGEFHHTLGACLVELRGKRFHLRQLNADKRTGAFIDLDTIYGVDWMKRGWAPAPQPVAALIMGDTHVDYIDPKVERATFGPGGIVETLKPRHLIWHDLCDGYAVNPHHNGNGLIGMAKSAAGKNAIRAEVERAVAFVEKRTPAGCTSVLIPSNHNDFLTRWLIACRDPMGSTLENFKMYCETGLAVADTLFHKDGYGAEYTDAFIYWAERLLPKDGRFKVLRRDESFTLHGVELSMHGDVGPNGTRGSTRNLRRIGVKSIIGHSHTPGIEEGCYQVGTSTRLRAEYTRGPSSWLNTHCALYANGKRSLLNIIDGEWRL